LGHPGAGRHHLAEARPHQLQVSSFLVDPTQERWSMFLVEARVYPWVYWHRVLKGRLHESRFMKPFIPLVRALGLAFKQP
jgi:sulfide:quinone oxidoreductase